MGNILFLLVILPAVGHTAHSTALFATVDSLTGGVFVSVDSGQTKAVAVGQKIYEGQTVTTKPDGELHLETADGGIVAIRPNTVFRVDEYKADGGTDDKIFMSLLKGAMRSITGWIGKYNPSGYRITTPTATIGIRGTDHETTVIDENDGDEPGTYDMVNDGVTVLKTRYGEREVTAKKFAFAPQSRAVAPLFLTRKPNFLAKRKLIIEQLIPQRKALLRDHLKQLRQNRIEQLEQTHPKKIRPEKIHDERAAQTGGKSLRKDERKAAFKNRREQAEPRRELRNMDTGQRREKNHEAPRASNKERRETWQSGSPEKPAGRNREQRSRPEHKQKNQNR